MMRRAFLSLLGLAPAAALAQGVRGLTTEILPGIAPITPNEWPSIQPPLKNAPECDRLTDCRFIAGMSVSTAMGCGPTVYGRDGRIAEMPAKCNTTTTEWSCRTCGKKWTETD